MLRPLQENPSLQTIQQLLSEGQALLLEGLWDSPKGLITALTQAATGKHVLILTGAGQEESRLFQDLEYFASVPVMNFPAWETLPNEEIPPSPDIVGERYQILHALTQGKPLIIISSLQACLQRLIPRTTFDQLYLTIKVGEELPFDTLLEQLGAMGYVRHAVASDKGEFAVRGGIIDLFPVSSPDPYRIEFWGDEVTSIRTYDPVGQKSVAHMQSVAITPAQELELIKDKQDLCSILDYLDTNTVVIFDELLALEDRYASLVSQTERTTSAFATLESLMAQVEPLQKIYLTETPIEELSEVHRVDRTEGGYYGQKSTGQLIAFEVFNRKLQAYRVFHPFYAVAQTLLPDLPEAEGAKGDELCIALGRSPGSEYEVHFLCAGEAEETHLKEKLKDLGVAAHFHFARGYLSSGFALPDSKVMLFPMTEITHRYVIRRQKQRSTYHTSPTEVYELSVGDTVVHLNNGIGRFVGLERRTNHLGIETEFFALEYADHAKLYVPMQQAHLLNKYIGSHDESPKLHTLGSNRWKTTREKTEKAILGYAHELLDVYAKRHMAGGFAFRQDSHDLVAFENEFPFVETEDQLRALVDIKADMTASKAMDRLVCGDVGYGKTEVAMRAAFKAVLDGGKQVAVLVPTTVLALQHYETFKERMGSFPVRIGVLSRYQSAKEAKQTLRQLAEGSIDILVGTHRIVSKDVVFKDLGLVIIDEEQRFGVKAKEHLKRLKTGVDCLTLTATPIPRTLYMSLVGARDLSVINTPPQDRLPVKTILAEDSDALVRSAILRELTRDGQVFFIHNRVESIFEVAARLQKMLPQARIVIGHGQMDAEEIDSVFHAFKSGRADILVSTTIVENGIDIPNANTILIDRADRFGMADLYQLRGRVGRWNRRAYAYLLVPRMRSLPEVSLKRLEGLMEASGYGSGMKIAMRDLEIRGAGDILGVEQSGHVSAVGFHLYCRMLKRTMQALKGEIPPSLYDTKMEFPYDARLPEEYVNEVGLRMEIYQRLGECLNWDRVDDIWMEIKDRYGPPLEPVKWLYHLTRLRVYASQYHITLLKLEKTSLVVERQMGKETVTKRMLLQIPKQPVELETKIIPLLKKELKLG